MRFRHIRERPPHLFWAAQVIAGIGHPHAVGIAQQRPGLDRQHDILQPCIFWIDVMDIIGSDKLASIPAPKFDQLAIDLGPVR